MCERHRASVSANGTLPNTGPLQLYDPTLPPAFVTGPDSKVDAAVLFAMTWIPVFDFVRRTDVCITQTYNEVGN